jgi:hypothetical protein
MWAGHIAGIEVRYAYHLKSEHVKGSDDMEVAGIEERTIWGLKK